MRGKTGTAMNAIEFAPRKKGNVKCSECEELIFKPQQKKKKKKKEATPNYYCRAKKQHRWYTAKCFCKQFKPRERKETK